MESFEQILERQHAYIKFKDGKVEYFSLSTQHGKADTLSEAIHNIIKADKRQEGKSKLSYMIDAFESRLTLPIM